MKGIELPMKNIMEIEECCGCGVCVESCPVKCIEMKQSKEGFLFPEVGNSCIKCGKCYAVCPIDTPLCGNKYIKSYAAYSRDEDVRRKSSSGGVFTKLAETVIKSGGSVFGAAFNTDMQLFHIEINRLSDIEKLRGSKYLQSNMKTVYKKVMENIQRKILTMVVGTPCQIAALKKFIKTDSEYLITIDLVCHGVPSPGMFEGYIKILEKKYHGKVYKYNFREKKGNGISYSTHIELLDRNNDKKTICIDGNEDPYIMNFLTNRLQRHSCFYCPYTKIERVGDITIADYWGVEEAHPELKEVQGVSLVLVNTKKGDKYLKKTEGLTLIETEEEKFSKKNNHLYEPPKLENVRDEFYGEYRKRGFDSKFYKKVFLPRHYKIFLLKRRILMLIKK